MLMDGLDFFNEFLMDCKLTNGLFLVHLLIWIKNYPVYPFDGPNIPFKCKDAGSYFSCDVEEFSSSLSKPGFIRGIKLIRLCMWCTSYCVWLLV